VEITVSSRHTEVSEALRGAVAEKLTRLTKYVEGMDRAEVHFFEERNPRIADKEVCEVTLEGHGHHVRCKAAAPDGFAAIDRAVEKLEHQLHKLKTKMQRRTQPARRGSKVAANGNGSSASADDEEGDGPGGRIVKTKAFTMKPMTLDEAVLRLDLLGHDFFFFSNADTGKAAVLYRRHDGDLGLIDEAR
jgi:putative sigma-54 modulation protein